MRIGSTLRTSPILGVVDEPDDQEAGEHSGFRVNRRTFVGASVTVGGAVAVGSLLAGCDDAESGEATGASKTLAVMHDGADVVTIEGLATNGRLHPLQQAFIDEDAFQCGYCTPGQILSGVACIKEGHAGSAAEIREWMSGNICRCGAYTNIVTAIAKTSTGA
jgi:xanthine dehydrogenase iron-sulfur cluster and FAD-binding subunit A